MGFSLVLDILVAGLLVVTISYAVVLNRRLRTMRQDKAELEKLAASFGAATTRAEDSIGRLKSTADDLRERIDKAQALRDDLAFLIDRGGSTADRLEEAVRAARDKAPVAPKVKAAEKIKPAAEPAVEAKSDAERELLKALQGTK